MRRDDRLDSEIQHHLDLLTAEYESRGMLPDEARYAARRAFGGVEPMKERYRDGLRLHWLEDLARDVRFGLRGMRRHPGLTLTAVLTLALGIGANTALFSVIDAVLLQPLQVEEPDELRLITVARADPTRPDASFSTTVYADMRDRVPAFSGVVAFGGLGSMRMTQASVAGTPPVVEPIDTQMVSGNFFSVLGVRPAAGRVLDGADERADAAPAAVISDGFWARRFGRDPSIVGRPIVVNNLPFTIVGVAPREFSGVDVGVRPEVWLPLRTFPQLTGIPPDVFNSRRIRSLRLIGRLRSGVDPARAEAQAAAVFETDRADLIERRTAQAGGSLPAAERARIEDGRLRLEPGRAGFTPLRWQFRRPLLILMVTVALVLLIACANVANLLLARAAGRGRELAVRVALGSGRARLVRQLLIESALLALTGGAAGVAIAMLGSRLVATFLQSQEISIPVSPDLRVLGFTVAVSLLAAFLVGIIPAVTATRIDLVNRDARGGAAPRLTMQHALVAGQVALSVVVLVVAGLFLRTLMNLRGLDIGVERDRLMAASLDLPPGGDPERRLATLRQILDRINTVPGQRAALSMFGMMSGAGWSDRLRIPGYIPRSDDDAVAFGVIVSADFFDVTGMRIVHGRPFSAADDASPTRVAVVNETLAKRFFDGQAVGLAVGRQLSMAGGEPSVIVGVVGDAIYRNLRDEAAAPSPTVYFPALQPPGSQIVQQIGGVQVQVRSVGRPTAVESAIREAMRQVDPGIVVREVRSMRTIVDATIARERLLADLAGWLGVVSLALGAIGIYGVRSYAVNRRVAEIGVRLALGATATQVAGRVVREGAAIAGAGIVVGLIAAGAVTRLIGGLLFGVTPLDVPTYAGVGALFLLVAMAASYIPALRATRIDPVVALRSD